MINELNSFNQLPVNGQTDAKLNLNILPVKLKCDTSDTTKKQEVKAGDIVVLGDDEGAEGFPRFLIKYPDTVNAVNGTFQTAVKGDYFISYIVITDS